MADRKRSAEISSPQSSSIEEQHTAKKALISGDHDKVTIVNNKKNPKSLPKGIIQGKLTPKAVRRFKGEALFRTLKAYSTESELYRSNANKAQKELDTLKRVFTVQQSWCDNLIDQIDIAIKNKKQLQIPGSAVRDNILLRIDATEDQIKEDELIQEFNKRNDDLKEKIDELFVWDGSVGEISDLKIQLSDAIKKLHEYESEYNKLQSDKKDLEAKLEDVTQKYLKTEKLYTRLKCPVTNAVFSEGTAPSESDSAKGSETPKIEANSKETAQEVSSLKFQIDSLNELISKQNEQMKNQDSQIEALNEKIRDLSGRLYNLSESDLQQSDAYRSLRRKYEDMSYLVNQLESRISHYQREKSAMMEERVSFEEKINRDTQKQIDELQARLDKAESDVSRIRAARDDLLSSLNIKKAQESEKTKGFQEIKELAEMRQARINSLEQEIARIKETQPTSTEVKDDELDKLSIEELKKIVLKLKQENASLIEELPELEKAYNLAHEKASKKVTDLLERENKMSRLIAEKAKTDEKYFGAMRSKDALNLEHQKVRHQLSKTAECVQQMKEVERRQNMKISRLEQQKEELTRKLQSTEKHCTIAESKLSDAERRVDSLISYTNKLSDDFKREESTIKAERKAKRDLEQEIAKLKKQLELQISANNSGGGSQNLSDVELQLREFRTMALCSVCSKNFKDTVIKVCGHTFCTECAEERLQVRLRKCPLCNKQYSYNDLIKICL